MSDQPADAYRGSDRRTAADRARTAIQIDYRGPNRRGPSASAAEPLGLHYAVFGCALAVLAFLAVRATWRGGRGEVITFAALRDAGFGVLVLTATVLLLGWALTGRASRALDGAAFLLSGAGLLLFAGPWGALVQDTQTANLVSPACRVALGVPALVLLTRSPSVVPVDSSIRPLRTLASAAAWALGLLGIEAAVHVFWPTAYRPAWLAAMVLLALAWATAGARRVMAPNSALVSGDHAMGWAMITWAAGDVMLGVTLEGGLGWGLLGVALQLLGAAGAAWVSVSWLLDSLSRDGSRRLRLVGELADVSTDLADEQSLRRHLVHDARNVVTAIHTATVTLERHGERLDPMVQEQLRGAIGGEFDRLQGLLSTSYERSLSS